MPGFSSIIGQVAKAATEHLSSKNSNNRSPDPTPPMSGSYNQQSAYNQPYSGQQSGYNQSYSSQQPGYGGEQYSPPSGPSPYGSSYSPHTQYPGQGPPPVNMAGQPIGFTPNSSYGPGYPAASGPGFMPSAGGGAGYPPASGGHGYPPSSGGHNQAPYTPYGQQQQPPSQGIYPTFAQDSIHYGSQHGGSQHGGSQYGGSQHGGSQHGGSQHGGSQHGGSQYGQQFSGHQQHQYGTMFSTPSIKPYPHFNAQHDADILRNAMKGLGCNKDKIIQVLCARSNAQRQEIARVFKTMYGKDLMKDLKSELHGDFEELALALMELPVNYDAHQLYKAMARLGTRENVLIEVMTTRTNAQIFQLKHAYKYLYNRELENDLTSETSGYFKRLLISMCAGGRDEQPQTDALRANQDARKLYRAGEQRLGTDEAQFSAILAAQNHAQLRLVFDEYQKVSGHSIEQAINAEFSGDIKDGLLAIVKCIRNRPAYFAELLNNAMKGLGTRDTDLIRIIVTRSEVDMADIRQEYQRLYGRSLEQAIAGDCSGAYKEGLIAIVKGN